MPTFQADTLEECLLSLPVPHSSTNQYFFGARDFLSPTTDSLWQVESGIVRTWTRTQNNQRVALDSSENLQHLLSLALDSVDC